MAIYRVKRFNSAGEILKKPVTVVLLKLLQQLKTPLLPKPMSLAQLQNIMLRLLGNAISLSNVALRLLSNMLRVLNNAIKASLLEQKRKLDVLKNSILTKRINDIKNAPKRLVAPFRRLTLPVPPKSI